jgi:hypothetical protein
VYTETGWPTTDEFIQRILRQFARTGNGVPHRRQITAFYKDLSAINSRAPCTTSPPNADTTAWPWILQNSQSSKRFPILPQRPSTAELPLPPKCTSRHPLKCHDALMNMNVNELAHQTTQLRRYISPVCFDVRLRTLWFILPVADKYGSATYRADRHCRFGCQDVETYKHLFYICPIACAIWRVHSNAWRPILLGVPGWKEMLFGVNLRVRQRFRKTTRAVAILWNVICAITFHTIWTIRNDKKHRDID